MVRSQIAKVSASLFALAFLAACQIQTPSDVLFAPTYDTRYVPETYGTKYDCKAYKAAGNTSGWKGIVGGKKYDFDRTFNVSRAGCFKTQAECQTFLTYMSGYIDMAIYSRCQAT
ncbi:hypothetical protein [Roseibium algae]|uniref:Uncharacterized protein n=1 Tax=Roseibium algae TaxID=3123038 RepID=A0ABU8TIA8_9HYPH